MRTAYLVPAGVVLAVAISLAQTVPPRARDASVSATATASVDGVVTAMLDGRQVPVRRARVAATSSTDSRTTDTDTSGRFHIDRLAAGSYKLLVTKAGFVPAGHPTLVDLPSDGHAAVSVQMVRGAAIEGRLTTEAGEPAVALTVTAGRLGYGPYGRFIVATEQALTDDLGRYRVHTLPAGDYYLEVTPDPQRMLQMRDLRGPFPKPAHTYFSGGSAGTALLNEARVLTLGAGQQAGAVDFSVESSVLASLSVHVVSAAGSAPVSYGLRVQRVGAPWGEVRCALLPEGPASCRNVPPGDFWLLAAVRAGPNGPPEYAAMRVAVAGRDQDVTVTTAVAASASGRLDADAPLPPNLHLQVVAPGTEYEFPDVVPGQRAPALTGPVADGGFTLSGLEGPRLFRVSGLPDGWALKSVKLGDADITDTPTALAVAGSPPISILVTKQTGAVAGTVLDKDGQPSIGSRVVVFSAEPRTWGARSRYIGTVETGPAGRYTVPSLLPGKYWVVAAGDLADGAWEDPDRLAQLQPLATSVTIAAGTTVTVDWRPR